MSDREQPGRAEASRAPAQSAKQGGLDAELDQSMDASDPPSATQPGGSDADEVQAHPS